MVNLALRLKGSIVKAYGGFQSIRSDQEYTYYYFPWIGPSHFNTQHFWPVSGLFKSKVSCPWTQNKDPAGVGFQTFQLKV